IEIVESAARDQLSANRLKVPRRDGAVICQEVRSLFFADPFRGVRAIPVRIIIQRKMRNRANRFDAGKRRELFLKLRHEVVALKTAPARRNDLEGQNVIRIEAGADSVKLYQRAYHQARADQ